MDYEKITNPRIVITSRLGCSISGFLKDSTIKQTDFNAQFFCENFLLIENNRLRAQKCISKNCSFFLIVFLSFSPFRFVSVSLTFLHLLL